MKKSMLKISAAMRREIRIITKEQGWEHAKIELAEKQGYLLKNGKQTLAICLFLPSSSDAQVKTTQGYSLGVIRG
jgi:hypothetical protein